MIMMEHIRISLPGKPEYVSIARLTASVIANQMGFNIDDVEDIKVAVGEACNNAVLHGRSQEEIFEVQFEVQDSRMVIEVRDNGTGFDLDEYQAPEPGELKENGLGIFIMKTLMDEVDFIPVQNNGTTIRLVKELQ